jgi:hypothetical protein
MAAVTESSIEAGAPASANDLAGSGRHPWKTLRANPACDIRWCFDKESPAWHCLENDSRAERVKSGKGRTVWRVAYRGGTTFAKVFDEPRWSVLHAVKRMLGLHPAAREWRALLQLEARGVPAIRAIALARSGRGLGRPRMVLLTQGVANACTLTEAWESIVDRRDWPAAKKRSLISALSALWARCHEQGYVHPDAHPANVLVQDFDSDDKSTARCLLLDPGSARWTVGGGHPPSTARVLRSLIMLDQYFRRRAARSDRLRFWREYWLQRRRMYDRASERALLAGLESVREYHRAELARRRDRRLSGDGRYFERVRLPGGWVGVFATRLERRHVFDERGVADRTIGDWERLLGRFVPDRAPTILAEHGMRALRRPVDVRGAWARDLFERTHRLRHRDLGAPLVLGYLQLRSWGSIRDEYLLLPELR